MTKVADFDPVAAVLEVRNRIAVPENERVGILAAREQIFARIASQPVATGTALQGIVASFTMKRVVPAVAGQVVGVVRPMDTLDLHQRVALGVAALRGARRQVDRHARIGTPVGSVIEAFTAIEHVRARAAVQMVGARSTLQRVITVPGVDYAAFRLLGSGIVVESRKSIGVAGPEDSPDSR